MSASRRPSPETGAVLDDLLARADAWTYGYELGKRCGLPSGTLYPILGRLEERGWIEGRWMEAAIPGRPPRHACRLTAEGHRAASAAAVPAGQIRPAAPAAPRKRAEQPA